MLQKSVPQKSIIFLAPISRSILNAFSPPQNHEKSCWRLGENQIFMPKSPHFATPLARCGFHASMQMMTFMHAYVPRFLPTQAPFWKQIGPKLLPGSLLETPWKPLGAAWCLKSENRITFQSSGALLALISASWTLPGTSRSHLENSGSHFTPTWTPQNSQNTTPERSPNQ